ncbi:hypothetical protein LWC34_04725 [Kibdelosporangium philippinense]|uniref:Uncharacterized protein n=1 Tax=Kibdelosporangium philippinense TaxID=211113 RepID=A0ABS8Z6E2_9PSEU|nr:hypothetical protein [Kibdelosporangium philippinense]MCE7002133.1 hypothetical protein [Kibdelosporangium philippinense]
MVVSSAAPSIDNTVTLKFYDAQGSGTELSADEAKSVIHGNGENDSDTLLDPATMQDLAMHPLYKKGMPGRWQFDIPDRPVAFAVNWPTRRGFSFVVLDDGGAGFRAGRTVVFNYQAAVDAMRRLNAALDARPDYHRSNEWAAAYAAAESNLNLARQAGTDSDRGKYGQLALDSIHLATDTLLAEYGPQYAKSRGTDPQIGVTIDKIDKAAEWSTLAQRVSGSYGWVRIVFDPAVDDEEGRGQPDPEVYRQAVETAKAAGLKILGQPVDSYFANRYTTEGYLTRVRAYVNAFPQIDAWEVGNEVNGCWLDRKTDDQGTCTQQEVPHEDRIINKIEQAARYVHEQRPDAMVVLTLYWQIGTDSPEWSTFNWARANLTPQIRRDIDTVLLSTWVEDAPLGLAFDQVMTTLLDEFPGKKVGLGELGYWLASTSRLYWAFDPLDVASARRELAAYYYSAALGYPRSVGGGYWWDFVDEMPTDPGLQQAVYQVTDQLAN